MSCTFFSLVFDSSLKWLRICRTAANFNQYCKGGIALEIVRNNSHILIKLKVKKTLNFIIAVREKKRKKELAFNFHTIK